ncbi:MAG: chorismate-binding protein [Halobacteriovoraceae bacterium]|nr:chorismate-binding protein [Halobacteriovoraceae bacterium]MCB9093954.1 chorismate-binding protein [Halobacteriovoraceae bacterium]
MKSGIEEFEKILSLRKIKHQDSNPVVYHLFYELGKKWILENTQPDIPLALEIHYENSSWVNCDFPKPQKTFGLKLEKKISYKKYQKKFQSINENLKAGNCYQVNYTEKFHYKIKNGTDILLQFYSQKKDLGAYAHHTHIPQWDKLILSNSPECLFQIYSHDNYYDIHTMPIKGTIKSANPNDQRKLFDSQKNQAELYMISDLMRNDLSRIEQPLSRVISKKKLLRVPGLWHLYSRMACALSGSINELQILKALFPGGSITGAPKKRVMVLIDQLEQSERGVYCGSTFLSWRGLKTASINIRTAWIENSLNDLSYGAGGGLTLLSECGDEYQEMLNKAESFCQVMGVDN